MFIGRRLALFAVMGTTLCPMATAQVTRSGSGGGAGAETARLMQQLQQATAERRQLQAEVTRLKAELESAKKAPAPAEADAAALRRRAQVAEASVSRSRASIDEANARAARAERRYDELAEKYRDTTKAQRELDDERTSLAAMAHRQHGDLLTCTDANAKLIAMNEDVVGRLEQTGFWSRVAADEPFLRLKRTELENLADSNRAAAAALKAAAPEQSPAAKQPAVPVAPVESTP
jgi:chromosome segregation ATPase